jgi:hypothetical protein
MKGFLIGVFSILSVLVLVAGYFGFFPGISSIFGSNKPIDLGVTYTSADSASGMAKGKVKHIEITDPGTPQGSLTFSGQIPAKFSLTQSEVTALINGNQWKYFPLSDVQVRFNSDNTVEASGILHLDILKDYALARGVSESDFNDAISKLNWYTAVQKEMPYYIKGTGSVVGTGSAANGVITFNCIDFKLGRLPIPASQINDRKADLLNLLNSDVLTIPGFSVKNFSISNGQMNFEGTLPAVVGRVGKG